MIALRRLGSVVFCGWIGAWIARAAFDWLLDVPRAWVVAALVVGAVLGGTLGLAAAIEEERKTAAAPQRDAMISTFALLGGVTAVACFFVGRFPWGFAAAAVVLGATAAGVGWSSPDR
jgi:hypothetical protein